MCIFLNSHVIIVIVVIIGIAFLDILAIRVTLGFDGRRSYSVPLFPSLHTGQCCDVYISQLTHYYSYWCFIALDVLLITDIMLLIRVLGQCPHTVALFLPTHSPAQHRFTSTVWTISCAS